MQNTVGFLKIYNVENQNSTISFERFVQFQLYTIIGLDAGISKLKSYDF